MGSSDYFFVSIYFILSFFSFFFFAFEVQRVRSSEGCVINPLVFTGVALLFQLIIQFDSYSVSI